MSNERVGAAIQRAKANAWSEDVGQDNHHLTHRDRKWLAIEVERLQAIVSKLPKTADGVPMAPGDVAFNRGDDRKWTLTTQVIPAWRPGDPNTLGFGSMEPKDLHSTPKKREPANA